MVTTCDLCFATLGTADQEALCRGGDGDGSEAVNEMDDSARGQGVDFASFDGPFDTEFVDALCREAGHDFFLYS